MITDKSSVKSADPVTYDDKGKVIPLSQRFNKASKDIRYALMAQEESFDIDKIKSSINNMVEARISDKRIRINHDGDDQRIKDSALEFFKEFVNKIIPLENGKRLVYFSPDPRTFERDETKNREDAWAEYSIHAVTSSGRELEGKDFRERLFNQSKVNALKDVERIIREGNTIVGIRGKASEASIIFTGTSNGRNVEIITRLDKFGDITANLFEVTLVIKGNRKNNNPQLMPIAEAVEKVAYHQSAGYSPSTDISITENHNNVNNPKASYVKEENEETPQKKTKASWEEWARQIKHMRDLQEEKRRKKEEFNNMTLAQKIKSFLKELPDKYEQNVSNHKHMLKKFEEEKSPLFENGTIPDNADPHMLLDTVDGRIQNKRDEFYAQNAQPIIDFLKENKITSTDFDLYLFAKHADERDTQINKINPDLAARGIRGSGWNEQSMGTPSAVQERLEKKYPKISEAADMFYKMNDKLLDIQLDYGLVSKDHVENIRKIYPHYCPLKRIDDKSLLDGIIYGDDRDVPNSVSFKSDIQEALGRTSRPEYPFMFALVSLDHVFRNGEMNLCNQALYLFAEKINDPSMQLGQRKVIRKLDPDRGEIVYRYSAELEPQTVVARFKGNPATVHIDDPDVYIAFTSPKSFIGLSNQMARAFRTLTAPLMQNATSRNVEFGLVNAFKDNQQAFIDNANTHGIKAATNILKGFWEGCRTFIDYERGKDTENTRLFREYLMNGGSTGYLDMLRLDKYADNLEKEINSFMITSPYQKLLMAAKHPFKTADRVLQKTSGYFFKYFELFNEMMETATRFANYKWFRQHGGKDGGEASALRAAEFAKNITLNFNRHGAKWTSEWNWAFMFSNAALVLPRGENCPW